MALQTDDCLGAVELLEEPLRVPARSGIRPHRDHMTVRLLQFTGPDVGYVLIVQRGHKDLQAGQLHKLLPVIRGAVAGVDQAGPVPTLFVRVVLLVRHLRPSSHISTGGVVVAPCYQRLVAWPAPGYRYRYARHRPRLLDGEHEFLHP